MKPSTRRIALFLGIFALFIVAYYVIRVVFLPSTPVPQQFKDARAEGALTGQKIVDESGKVAATLNQVSDLEKQGKIEDALKDITTVRDEARDIQNLALDLSKQVEAMNAALPSISSADARQAALDGISNYLALVSRLITYTTEVRRLADALETHLRSGRANATAIQKLLIDVNGDVTAVNSFNQQATQAMERFDKIVR